MVREQRRCPGITAQGKPCPLFPPTGRTWCINHDPERKEEKHARSVKGGRNRASAIRARKLAAGSMRTMGEARDYCLMSAMEVHDGEISPRQGQAISALLRTADALTVTEALEQQIADQGRRIAQLEDFVAERVSARQAG